MAIRAPKFDRHPVIEMRMLRAERIFQTAEQSNIGYWHHLPIYITYSVKGSYLLLEYIAEGERCEQLVNLKFSRVGFGVKAFFLCPETDLRCERLHLRGQKFVSRGAYPDLSVRDGSPTQRLHYSMAMHKDALLGLGPKGPVRGRNRQAAIDALNRHPWTRDLWPEIIPHIKRDTLRAQVKARTTARRKRIKISSTVNAMRAGYGLKPLEDFKWRFLMLENVSSRPAPVLPRLDWSKAILEEHCALSIGTLLSVLNDGDRYMAWQLHWKDEDILHTQRRVLVDLFHEPSHMIITDAHGANNFKFQQVDIVRDRRNRYRFVCPVEQKRCDILFLRGDRFASAKGQNLINKSQRSRNFDPR